MGNDGGGAVHACMCVYSINICNMPRKGNHVTSLRGDRKSGSNVHLACSMFSLKAGSHCNQCDSVIDTLGRQFYMVDLFPGPIKSSSVDQSPNFRAGPADAVHNRYNVFVGDNTVFALRHSQHPSLSLKYIYGRQALRTSYSTEITQG